MRLLHRRRPGPRATAARPAAEPYLADEPVLLGMLSEPDSVAARVLAKLGVSLAAAQAALASRE